MQNKLITLSIALLAAFSMNAQPINDSAYDVLIKSAELAVQNYDYYNALDLYEKAYEQSEDKTLLVPIAELQYNLRDYYRASKKYRQLLRRDKKNEYKELRFYYARSLKMIGNYDDAIQEFNRFIDETDDPKMKKLAELEVTGAEMALVLPENPTGVAIANLGRDVNSPLSEYSPVLEGGGLYFAGFERKRKEAMDVEEDGEDARVHIFKIEKKDKKRWGKPVELDEKINRPGYHSTNVAFSPDGNRMFFNRAQVLGNILNSSKIYMSEGGDGNWKAAVEVEGVNGDYIAKHPAVGELFGKEVLFFVSDMPGGHGGDDLYYATYLGGGKYDTPVNLGEKINSEGNEATPYYIDGTLYFSSDGFPGIGGYDIFYTVWNGSNWSEPKNMGKTFNSPVDDLYFRMSPDGYTGVLTSNRIGGRSAHGKTCCDDIYAFEIPQLYTNLVAGVFTEKVGKVKAKGLKGATVTLIETVDNTFGTPISKTNDKGNRFEFGLEFDKPYTLIAEKEGYFPDTITFNTVGLTESKTFEKRFYLKKKPYVAPPPEFDTIYTDKPFVLDNILYDFDKDLITQQAEIDLNAILDLMNQYPEMKIELRSHTDFRGEADYNEDLSQRRAESARRWLVRHGISRDRIEAKGYGESVPQTITEKTAALNPTFKVGDVLTEEYINALATEAEKEAAHALNRRTEFQIIAGPKSVRIPHVREKKPAAQKVNKKKVKKKSKSRKTRSRKSKSRNSQPKAAKQATQKGTPKMTFNTRMIDLGKVRKGEKRSFSYTFKNTGTAPLQIDLISACDCTTTDYPTKKINPGEEGVIKVVFDSSEKEESEVIDIDIFLTQNDEKGNPRVEMIQYKFDLIK